MEIKKQVKEIYDLLPDGSKQRAAEIHGVTVAYFRRIADGEPKDDSSVYYSALQAMKQAASERLLDVKAKVDAINSIEVVEPKEIKKQLA